MFINAKARILIMFSQGAGEADIRTLGRLFAELNLADALQPVLQCGRPGLVKHIAVEICVYLDTLRVRLTPRQRARVSQHFFV